MDSRTTIDIADGVARITLDDGKVNALSTKMISEIEEGLDLAEQSEAIVVLAGRAGIFSAGFDMPTFTRGVDAAVEMLQAGARLIVRLLTFPRPVFTVCTGHAYPAGAFLMMSADVRFGIAGDWKIGMNEVAIGLTVPRFAVELARHRLTPPGFVTINTGRMWAPDEALRLGYLDRVFAPEVLDKAVAEEVDRLRTLDMPSFAATKARVNAGAVAAISEAVETELTALAGS